MTCCFRLDSTLREVCAEDIEAVCGYERDSLDSVEGFDARVIQCLQVPLPMIFRITFMSTSVVSHSVQTA